MANIPMQEQVAQPGSDEQVNQAEQNLFDGVENVQQIENMVANENQENLQIEVTTEPKLLILNSLDLKHENPWEQPKLFFLLTSRISQAKVG